MRIAIILASTRPGRRGAPIAHWMLDQAQHHHPDVSWEVVDLATLDLPLLNEPVPAIFGAYRYDHTRQWASTIAAFDGFVFVTPEYNHGIPAALKNALDYLFAEWGNKAAGLVGYGVDGGQRATEQLRLVLGELAVATVRSSVHFSVFRDFDHSASDPNDPTALGILTPGEDATRHLGETLDEVVAWSRAMQSVRIPEAVTTGGAVI